MNTIYDMTFKRKFSVNLFKDTRLNLAKMTFTKDWLTTDRGEPYPVIAKSGEADEKIIDNKYVLENKSGKAEIKRLIGQHFSFATYEVATEELSEGATAGVSINAPLLADKKTIDIYLKRIGDKVKVFYALDGEEKEASAEKFDYSSGMALTVMCHHGEHFDVYVRYADHIKKVNMLEVPEFERSINERVFKNATASLFVGFDGAGKTVISKVEMYIDAGLSQADMKPVRYEDGCPIMENGKLFMTMTSRFEAAMYQSVLSWNPSSCEFNLEGILLFDVGDGDWCGDVASSLIYDRNAKNWKIWMCSFSHGHILGHAEFENDPRFGINVIDITLMPEKQGSADTEFFAKFGDEDPDLLYVKEENKWYMTICRSDSTHPKGAYSYFLFESDKPFSDFKFVSKTSNDAITGGMFVKVAGKQHFVCGANFDKRAQYNIYDCPDFTKCTHIKCDFDDGGFRGWGTVIPVPCGTRTKYVWITFDRHNASDYNWSYGTLYVYEADLMNKGYEW